MKSLITTATITLMLIITACNPNNPNPACNTANTDFQQLYTSLTVNPAYQDITTMDLVTHEYSFIMNTTKTVCSIGYQSNANIASQPYLIEIVDNASNTNVYSGSIIFSSASTSYASIPGVVLNAGTSYTIKRTVTNYMGNIGNTTGRIVKGSGANPMAFPYTASFFTITGSNFYGTGGPVPNYGIPFIDIAFQ